MLIEVVEESPAALQRYGEIPIAFRVETRFQVVPNDHGLGGLTFFEEPVVRYVKDYDVFEAERPSAWANRFDISRWGIFFALYEAQPIGGAVVAWSTPEVDMLEGREDLACLWDLRVHPDHREMGIGRVLFSHAASWARERQCRQLKVETQNINVPACKFYVRQGCELGGISKYAYGAELNEVQLLWYLDL